MSAGRPRTTVRHGGRTMARLVCVSALGRMTHTRDVVHVDGLHSVSRHLHCSMHDERSGT